MPPGTALQAAPSLPTGPRKPPLGRHTAAAPHHRDRYLPGSPDTISCLFEQRLRIRRVRAWSRVRSAPCSPCSLPLGGRCSGGGTSGGSPVGGRDRPSFPETLVFRACTEASMISAARAMARLVGSGSLEKDRSCDGRGISLLLRSLRQRGDTKRVIGLWLLSK